MKTRKGFELIELMSVVLVVGILAALIIPVFRARVEKAKYTAVRNAFCAKLYSAKLVDPNQLEPYNEVVDRFVSYLKESSPGSYYIYSATAKDVEHFLVERKFELRAQKLGDAEIEEVLGFERKALMLWLETIAEVKKEESG